MNVVEGDRYLVTIADVSMPSRQIVGCFSAINEAEDYKDIWIDNKVDQLNLNRTFSFNMGDSCGPAITREEIAIRYSPMVEQKTIAIRVES